MLTDQDIRDYERHQDRVFLLKLRMLYSNIQDYGINSEHCWELMKIAEEMYAEGYASLKFDEELRAFKNNFTWWGDFQTIWQPLYSECMNALNVF
jgi:hypothetical protein